jgi:hypothetical protein
MNRLFTALAVALLLVCSVSAQVAVSPAEYPKLQFLTLSGSPCAACTISTFAGGTTTPLATYTDSTGTVTNPVTITLNSAGYPPNQIWLASASTYKLVLKDASGVTIYTVDNIKGGISTSLSNSWGGTQNFTALTLNGTSIRYGAAVVDGSQLSGSTLVAKFASCPNPGICDFRGLGTSTYAFGSSMITVNAGQTLLFDPSTKFQAGTSSLNLFTFEPNAIVRGFTFDCTNQPSYTGIMFQNDTSQFYTNGQTTELSDVTANSTCAAITTGAALKLTSTSVSKGVAFVKVKGWRVYGLGDGAWFTTSGTGWVNGVHMLDMLWSNTTHGWRLTPVTGGAGQNVSGNICELCSYEKDSTGVNGWLIDGTGGNAVGNQWIGGTIWDTTTAISITNNGGFVTANSFLGRYDGVISDVTNTLTYCLNHGDCTIGGTLNINSTAGGDTIAATQATINQKTLHLSNTGGALYVAVDNSTGSGFAHGNYVSNWYSPGNNSYFQTPLATFSAGITAIGNVTAAGFVGTGSPKIATGSASNTDPAGKLTLVAGTATYTFTNTYLTPPICISKDLTTSTNATNETVTTTTLTLTGTGTDQLKYICVGLN